MNIKKQLKNLLDTAQLYHSQGLLFEAKGKYEDAITFIQESEHIEDGQNITNLISKKISALKKDIENIEKQPALPEVEEDVQDVIKDLFTETEGKDKDEALAVLDEGFKLYGATNSELVRAKAKVLYRAEDHQGSLELSKVLIEECRKEYNQVRPHSALNYRPPAPEATMPVTLT